MILAAALAETLALVAGVAAGAVDRWWIIGSAAVALHGGAPISVADVDLLMSARDARALASRIGVEPIEGGGTELFRSAVFARWQDPPLTVEIIAEFHVREAGRWSRIEPRSREAVGHGLYVPSRDEVIGLLHRFGRPKDLARAALLA